MQLGLQSSRLVTAARAGQDLAVENLATLGADTKAVDNDGKTALHYAAQAREYLTIETLVKLGADIKAVDNDGKTAGGGEDLGEAKRWDSVKLLFRSGMVPVLSLQDICSLPKFDRES
jgi:hypothetical protein